jgi:hypothetical protein
MNLSLVFLHGEQVLVGLGLAGLMVLVGGPLVLYVWLWHTKISELTLTVAYLILMAVLCVRFGLGPSLTSVLSLTMSMLGLILSLPWSVLASWALREARNSPVSDGEFALLMMLAAGINAALLYLAAGKMRRLISNGGRAND